MKSLVPPAKLRIQVAEDYEDLSRQAAELILKEMRKQPGLLLCASAGGTPTRTYGLLAAKCAQQPQWFKKLRVLQIDEWGGLAPDNPATCQTDLCLKLLQPLQVIPKRYVGFRSDAPDPPGECQRIAQWLAVNGPIGVCILGLGTNGHVAMNEPADALNPHPHVAKLAKSSQYHPMLKDLRRKPRYGLTLGIGDILRSRKILLLVNGAHKRAALERVLEPRVTTRFPASFLWLHPDATVLCDRSAAPAPRTFA